MPQEIQQLNNQTELTPDEAAASLGLATKLSEQLLPKRSQTQEKGSPSDLEQKGEEIPAKEEKVDLEANNKEMEKTMDTKLDEFRKEIKETIKEEISGIKDSIKEALEEDEE